MAYHQTTVKEKFLSLLSVLLLSMAGGFLPGIQTAHAQGDSAPGPEVCAGCHEERAASYTASIHGQKGHPKSPASNGGCAACHGNGAEHVKAGGGRGVGGIVNPRPGNKAMPAQAKSAICLNCHDTSRELGFWDSGKHKQNDVTCSNCHDVHTSTMRDNAKMLRDMGPLISVYTTTSRQPIYQVCVSCHKDVRAQMNKPSHHPVIEGKMSCASCHNPHGTVTNAMVRSETVRALCLTCHTDKRGPWIHEHPPVEENCMNCHTPHGSNHNRMLAMKPPQLCQECHRMSAASTGGHPGTLVDGRPVQAPASASAITARLQEGGCVNCHRQIHGSNAPPSANGQFLVR